MIEGLQVVIHHGEPSLEVAYPSTAWREAAGPVYEDSLKEAYIHMYQEDPKAAYEQVHKESYISDSVQESKAGSYFANSEKSVLVKDDGPAQLLQPPQSFLRRRRWILLIAGAVLVVMAPAVVIPVSLFLNRNP
jgi:hypothetical protein